MVRSLPGRPFLTPLEIKRFRAKYRFWPPQDASPVIAIEPWGKQMFVYNGMKDVEIVGDPRAAEWGNVRPQWWRESIALSMLKPGEDPNRVLSMETASEDAANNDENMTHTHLCITDFRRRPLMYLNSDELNVLVDNLSQIKEQLAVFRAKLKSTNEAEQIEKLNSRLEDDKYMHIRRGRVMNPPQRSGRGVMSAPNRPPRRRN
jgi:hypothetical protein